MKSWMLFLLLLVSFASCKRNWTDKDKAEFTSGCLNRASRDMGGDSARAYCRCLLEKVVKHYPNANDAKYIRYDSTVRQLAKDCLKQPGQF
ncbi:MAG TPA: hypothetical protein VFR58_16080 [Flavisolibacter sp.]|nr:hypothetical protein [Flavisolibacter sp.]